MQKVVSFYEKLPRGPAPAARPKGLTQWYQQKYFGDKPSAMRMSALSENLDSRAYGLTLSQRSITPLVL